MTVQVNETGVIELSGRCGAEDAETLQHRLLAAPGSTVEWTGCEYLHSAVIQVLLAGQPPIRGMPVSPFLATYVAPILLRRRSRSEEGMTHELQTTDRRR